MHFNLRKLNKKFNLNRYVKAQQAMDFTQVKTVINECGKLPNYIYTYLKDNQSDQSKFESLRQVYDTVLQRVQNLSQHVVRNKIFEQGNDNATIQAIPQIIDNLKTVVNWVIQCFTSIGIPQDSDIANLLNNLKTIQIPTQVNNKNTNQNLTPLQSAFLMALDKRRAKGNTSEASYNSLLNLINTGQMDKRSMLNSILQEFYNDIRVPPKNYYENAVKNGMPHDHNVDEVSGKDTNIIEVRDEGGWFYRLPKNRKQKGWNTSEKVASRISFAAIADKNLIAELDNYVSNVTRAYYKTPADIDSWLERHDPITIYFIDPPEKTINVLSSISQKYSRANYIKTPLEGKPVGNGLSQESSPDESDIKVLLDKSNNLDPVVGNVVYTYLFSQTKGKLSASAGQVLAVNAFLDYIKDKLN